MADIIRGPVTNVVDGATFEMKVTHVGKDNSEKYNNKERLRISGVDAPELKTSEGQEAKKLLEDKISGKELMCTVHARETSGRIVADVTLLK